MLKAVLLMLTMTIALFALCLLCRAATHALTVRRVGVGSVVVVGRNDDPLLPRRVVAAHDQIRFCHFEDCGRVLVLDCGLTEENKTACEAALGGEGRVIFLSAEKLADYLLASSREK